MSRFKNLTATITLVFFIKKKTPTKNLLCKYNRKTAFYISKNKNHYLKSKMNKIHSINDKNNILELRQTRCLPMAQYTQITEI